MTGTAQQNSKAQQVHISASSGAGAAPLSVTLDPQAQLESDKRAVYRWDQPPAVLAVNGKLKYNVQVIYLFICLLLAVGVFGVQNIFEEPL